MKAAKAGRKSMNGVMVIIAQEVKSVEAIYRSFVQGVHPGLIATGLNGVEEKTVYGNTHRKGMRQLYYILGHVWRWYRGRVRLCVH